MREIVPVGVGLVLQYLPVALASPHDAVAREALALATDLGGYAIMLGGTSGPHLNSFSLVNVMSHGRACALLGPYYTVFYAPAAEEPLRVLAEAYRQAGLLSASVDRLRGHALGIAVAQAMIAFLARRPADAARRAGVTPASCGTCWMPPGSVAPKLENMPVP